MQTTDDPDTVYDCRHLTGEEKLPEKPEKKVARICIKKGIKKSPPPKKTNNKDSSVAGGGGGDVYSGWESET